MPYVKRRLYSFSGCHNDDRLRKASDFFRKAYTTFFLSFSIFIDLYRRFKEILNSTRPYQIDKICGCVAVALRFL